MNAGCQGITKYINYKTDIFIEKLLYLFFEKNL